MRICYTLLHIGKSDSSLFRNRFLLSCLVHISKLFEIIYKKKKKTYLRLHNEEKCFVSFEIETITLELRSKGRQVPIKHLFETVVTTFFNDYGLWLKTSHFFLYNHNVSFAIVIYSKWSSINDIPYNFHCVIKRSVSVSFRLVHG